MVLKGSKTTRNTGNTTRSRFSSRRIRKLVPHHNHFLKLMCKARGRETVATYSDDDDDDGEDFGPREVIPHYDTRGELGRSAAIRRWLSGLMCRSVLAGSGSHQKNRWHLLDYMRRILNSVSVEKEPFKVSLKNLGVMANYGVWEERHREFLDLCERESMMEAVRRIGTVSSDPPDTRLRPIDASVAQRLYTLWCELWEEREEEEATLKTPRRNRRERNWQRRLSGRVSAPSGRVSAPRKRKSKPRPRLRLITKFDGQRFYTVWEEVLDDTEDKKTAASQNVQKTAASQNVQRTRRARHNQHNRGLQRRRTHRHGSVPPRANHQTTGRKTTGGGIPIPEQPKPITAADLKRNHKFWSVRCFERGYEFSRTRVHQDRRLLAEQMPHPFDNVRATKDNSGDQYDYYEEYAADVGMFLTSVEDSDEDEFRPPRSNVFPLMDFATRMRKKLRPIPDKRPRTPLYTDIQPAAPPDKTSASRQASFFLTEVTDFDVAFSDVDGALCTCTLPAGDLKARPIRGKFGSAVDFGKCVPFTAVFDLRGAASVVNDGGRDSGAGVVDPGWLLVCQAATSPGEHRVWSETKGARVKVSFKLHGGAGSGVVEEANTALKRTLAGLREAGGSSVLPSINSLLKHACDALSKDSRDGQQGSAQSQSAGLVSQSQNKNASAISGTCITQDFMETRCSNCFTLYDGEEVSKSNVPLFITMTTCGHNFCRKCWQRHLVCGILSGKRTLLCMGYKCGNTVDATTVLSLVPHWAFVRWQQLLMPGVPNNQEVQTGVAEKHQVGSKQLAHRSLETAKPPVVREKNEEVATIREHRTTIPETKKTTPRQGQGQAEHLVREKRGVQLAVAGQKVPRQKRPVKAAGPATPRLKPKAEPEVLSKSSLVHLARGLGKDNNGLTLPMLLNMPTTAIINAIYDNDDTATGNVTTKTTSINITTNSSNNKKTISPEQLTDKQRGVWMLEKCLLAWQQQTSGLQDEVRMRSMERALMEMGKGKLAADVMQCYRDQRKITPDLFTSQH